MPRSTSRRTIEVTAAFYDELKAEATQEQRSIPEVLYDLVRDGRSMREWYGRLNHDLGELRREVRALREDLSDRGTQPPAARSGTDPDTHYRGGAGCEPRQFYRDACPAAGPMPSCCIMPITSA